MKDELTKREGPSTISKVESQRPSLRLRGSLESIWNMDIPGGMVKEGMMVVGKEQ